MLAESTGTTGVLAASSMASSVQISELGLRQSCEACRLRRVKCTRKPGQMECMKCQAMDIQCVWMSKRPRSGAKYTRIAQLRELDRVNKAAKSASQRLVVPPRATSGDLSHFSAAATLATTAEEWMLLRSIVGIYGGLRVAKLPLIRWMDINGVLNARGDTFAALTPIDQALFLSVAAVAARSVKPEAQCASITVGGPSSENGSSGSGSTSLSRRAGWQDLADELLLLAKQKLDGARVFTDPKAISLSGVAALQMVHMLTYTRCEDPSVSEDAEIEASAYSSTSVRHLRILAAKLSNGIPETRPFAEAPDQCTALGFVAWTAAIRDVGRSLATGTACEFTDDDVASLLGIDPNLPLPSPEQIVQTWANVFMPEGDLILVWAHIVLQGREIVHHLTQPSARHKPRISIRILISVLDRLAAIRSVLLATERLAAHLLLSPEAGPNPAHLEIMSFSCDWIIARMHEHIVFRLQEAQLEKAARAGKGYAEYEHQLWQLLERSDNELHAAMCRTAAFFKSNSTSSEGRGVDRVIPGFHLYESVVVWADLALDTKCYEEGGRVDYSFADKIDALRVFRDCMTLPGWSSSKTHFHTDRIDRAIGELVKRKISHKRHSQSILAHFQVLSATTPASNLHSPASAGSAAAAGSLFRTEVGQLPTSEMSANESVGTSGSALSAFDFDWSQFMIEEGSPPLADSNHELDAILTSAEIQSILEQCGMIPSAAGSIES